MCDTSSFLGFILYHFWILLDLGNSNVIIYCMGKLKKLYLVSLGFLIVSLVFIALLVFARIVNENEEYVLVERIFHQGISAMFFYLAYSFGAISLTLSILSIFKDNHLLKRSSFFIKIYFIILLVSPFFTSIYYEFAHEASFFTLNLLAIAFLAISMVIEYFALRDVEENIHRDDLIKKYRIVINFDYFLLLISGLIIIISSFIVGDFYLLFNIYLPNIPIYFIPVLSLIFYIFNSFRLNYISSKYYSLLNIINSRFIYYFVAYLSIVRLGFFAYSNYSFYEGLKILRLILLLVFISIVIFNSFLPKIDLSFLLAGIIITLFTFEVVGMVKAIKDNGNMVFAITSFLLDYIIVIFIALPYYIYNGINRLFLKR